MHATAQTRALLGQLGLAEEALHRAKRLAKDAGWDNIAARLETECQSPVFRLVEDLGGPAAAGRT